MFSPVLGGVPHLDELGAGEQLHDEARGDDGRDAQLHQRAPARRICLPLDLFEQLFSIPVELIPHLLDARMTLIQ